MDDRLYNTLKWVAIALGLAWVTWAFYDAFLRSEHPHAIGLETGNKYFADGYYEQALAEFESILHEDPQNFDALRGVARSLMQLGRNEAALRAFDDVIARQPEFGPAYANRGILNDRMANYRAAIRDYEKAAALDAELNEGPHWLTRFLRNQPEQQATIVERARYLRAQLALPEDQRVLRVPEMDARQRPYDQ